jgi:DNA-binding HxlR family transcriptional regulator
MLLFRPFLNDGVAMKNVKDALLARVLRAIQQLDEQGERVHLYDIAAQSNLSAGTADRVLRKLLSTKHVKVDIDRDAPQSAHAIEKVHYELTEAGHSLLEVLAIAGL